MNKKKLQPRGKETGANAFVSHETRYPVVVAMDYEGLENELLATTRGQITFTPMTG